MVKKKKCFWALLWRRSSTAQNGYKKIRVGRKTNRMERDWENGALQHHRSRLPHRVASITNHVLKCFGFNNVIVRDLYRSSPAAKLLAITMGISLENIIINETPPKPSWPSLSGAFTGFTHRLSSGGWSDDRMRSMQ